MRTSDCGVGYLRFRRPKERASVEKVRDKSRLRFPMNMGCRARREKSGNKFLEIASFFDRKAIPGVNGRRLGLGEGTSDIQEIVSYGRS